MGVIWQTIKETLKRSIIFDMMVYVQQRKELCEWYKSNKTTAVPHLIKQRTVLEYAQRFSLSTLIETGTYFGFMVNATKRRFRRIHSIELDDRLYQRAYKKFSRFKHVSIHQGDSSRVLPMILTRIQEPCLFWLDAHYSSGITARGERETPIMEEGRCILSHPLAIEHVILIDDARNFVGANDYPTLEELNKLVSAQCLSLRVYVENDIIRIHHFLE
jgi:hypothetical protein